MNSRTRQKIKAELRGRNPAYFATIRENGVTRVQFVARSEREYYKMLYGDKIKFWDEQEAHGT